MHLPAKSIAALDGVLHAEYVGEVEPGRMPLPLFLLVGFLRGAIAALPVVAITLLLVEIGVLPS